MRKRGEEAPGNQGTRVVTRLQRASSPRLCRSLHSEALLRLPPRSLLKPSLVSISHQNFPCLCMCACMCSLVGNRIELDTAILSSKRLEVAMKNFPDVAQRMLGTLQDQVCFLRKIGTSSEPCLVQGSRMVL